MCSKGYVLNVIKSLQFFVQILTFYFREELIYLLHCIFVEKLYFMLMMLVAKVISRFTHSEMTVMILELQIEK